MKSIFRICGALIYSILLIQCSSKMESEYSRISNLLSISENTYKSTYNYEIKLRACDDAIRVLNENLKKFEKDKDLYNIMKTTFSSWYEKKDSILNVKDELNSKLVNLTDVSAKSKAMEYHPFSDIEKIKMIDDRRSVIGNKIQIIRVYDVRMRGALEGTNIFKFNVEVPGYISMENNDVFVIKDKIKIYD